MQSEWWNAIVTHGWMFISKPAPFMHYFPSPLPLKLLTPKIVGCAHVFHQTVKAQRLRIDVTRAWLPHLSCEPHRGDNLIEAGSGSFAKPRPRDPSTSRVSDHSDLMETKTQHRNYHEAPGVQKSRFYQKLIALVMPDEVAQWRLGPASLPTLQPVQAKCFSTYEQLAEHSQSRKLCATCRMPLGSMYEQSSLWDPLAMAKSSPYP
jgi:hypothetical protein